MHRVCQTSFSSLERANNSCINKKKLHFSIISYFIVNRIFLISSHKFAWFLECGLCNTYGLHITKKQRCISWVSTLPQKDFRCPLIRASSLKLTRAVALCHLGVGCSLLLSDLLSPLTPLPVVLRAGVSTYIPVLLTQISASWELLQLKVLFHWALDNRQGENRENFLL